MERYQDKAGVTLVELLIVIAVLSVLVSLVLAGAGRLHNQGKERLVRETFSLLDGALQEYHESTGQFPATREDPLPPMTLAERSEKLLEELRRPGESRIVLGRVSNKLIAGNVPDPNETPELYDPWGTLVYYRYAPGDNFPLLESAGADRIFGTPDDITNR
ncbi:MAG: type II secretion system protein [Planctomycetota bacterium]|jgi:prepilin-type N-terminal cleavage/methylation domain-containing protein